MSQTMHDRAELHRFNRRRLTAAGAFWVPYLFVVVLLIAYAVVS
jgi:hypothetical protein